MTMNEDVKVVAALFTVNEVSLKYIHVIGYLGITVVFGAGNEVVPTTVLTGMTLVVRMMHTFMGRMA